MNLWTKVQCCTSLALKYIFQTKAMVNEIPQKRGKAFCKPMHVVVVEWYFHSHSGNSLYGKLEV